MCPVERDGVLSNAYIKAYSKTKFDTPPPPARSAASLAIKLQSRGPRCTVGRAISPGSRVAYANVRGHDAAGSSGLGIQDHGAAMGAVPPVSAVA